jgi:hypothetical protein
VQAFSQQMLPTQAPFVHWLFPEQPPPSPIFAVQVPPEQYPLTQSPSAAHVVLHAVTEAQTSEPGHAVVVVGRTQDPAPLQVCGPVIMLLLPQAGGPHIVPPAPNWQAPFPSHSPLSPQVVWAFVQRPFELPLAVIGRQRPLCCPVSVLEQD